MRRGSSLSLMEHWPLLLSLFLPAAVFFVLFFFPSNRRNLPPGPLAIPIVGNLQWLRYSLSNLEPLLRHLHASYGPIFAMRVGSLPTIFIADRRLAHKALVEHGAAFADRPTPFPVTRIFNSNQHNISSARYGPLWRLLRRNLAAEILHPAKVGLFADGRNWVLGILVSDLRSKAEHSVEGIVIAKESFQLAVLCLLALMCFGEKLEEMAIREIESARRELRLYTSKLSVFAFIPRVTKHIFRQRWETMMRLRQRQIDMFVPLIRDRREIKEKNQRRSEEDATFVHSYVDSLLEINLPEEGGRKLTEEEMVTLCSEFFTAGIDTTATALQWIMAELVKRQEVQAKLLEEIESVAGEEIKEEDLQRMPYLKAVIMEGLRRHPPAHFVLSHSVTEDMELEGYMIPKNARINFMVAEMGWDEKVWEDSMEFRPERFMAGGEGEGVDITGNREIKMMPFGVGRRICPGLGLAMLHLEFFVANLVKEFEWRAVVGEVIDLSEKPQFLVEMKNPLRTRLRWRRNPCD